MTVFVLLTLFLMALLLAGIETGRRIRLRQREEQTSSGLSVIDGAIFGLLGLLLAFAFSGADARFEARRQLIVQETNAIGTAWLRVDLLPAAAQPKLRQDFRQYVDDRIAFYRDLNDDPGKAARDFSESNALQMKIWSESIAAARQDSNPAVLSLVLSSLNDMIDITTTRSVALQTHPPLPIYILLFVLALASSLVAGFGMGDQNKRPWLHVIVYAVALTITIYTILDLEFPRVGIIRIDRYDKTLVNQRDSMK
ncbi:hypothetical protein HNQ77_002906 [Silvibacterium bohemicum]|uniref:DUF4239 domain-containing protein n=1 Tax=Silvibacterium bohemicum TaxID=1577686 RepID=A0A841JUW5_9BACT|nr:hypothetical protein [Silvibacterium bohemicum]MBB6144950.1 hypothetical protein [Silvibacterium bohemicum]